MQPVRGILCAAGLAGGMVSASLAHGAGWYSGVIEQVEITNTGEVMAFLQAPNNHECGTKRVDYIVSGTSAQYANRFLSALLA